MKALTVAMVLVGLTATLGAQEKEQRLAVTVLVPDLAWMIVIDEVYQVGKALVVVSEVTRREGATAIIEDNEVSAAVTVTAPALPVKHIVLGMPSYAKRKEPYEFVKRRKDLGTRFADAKLIYKREKQAGQ
jgi:hypothetical protein